MQELTIEAAATVPPIAATPRGPRLLFIDNIRWVMIILVVSMHAADTYSPLGNWYFTDRSPVTPAALLTFAAWQMYLQAFFMGLLFFIAGYFVPSSLQRKGARKFIRERAFRLGLPVLFYMFVLGPITEYFVAHSWNSTEPTSFANEWIKHIRNGQFLQENGPLWFCLALLIFCVCYAAFHWRQTGAVIDASDSPAPNNARLIGFAFVMAAFTFVVRLVFPDGTSVLNLQLADFPQYILLFIAGTYFARGHWLQKLDYRLGVRWLAIVLPVGFAAWLAILIVGGRMSGDGSAYAGGWHWQAAAMNLWESFTCVAVAYGLLVIFRRAYNTQGRFEKVMSDNAFSVYVFHPPFVILGARLLHPIAAAPLFKFALLTIVACIASFALSAAVFRRTPVLRAIL
ncbi:MAG TPA: acyltransferase family protein [Gemmatimonadaceae bacterium]|nr:acyltransferase family protein [Gemmatimonadaceae bacterium]